MSGGFIQYNKVQSASSVMYEAGQFNAARSAFEAGLGHDISKYLRIEALVHRSTLHYANKKWNGRQKITTLAATANVCVSPDLDQYQFTPFLTLGCGIGYNDASDWKSTTYLFTYRGHKKRNFIWSAGGGLMFHGISRNYSCEIAYKYLSLGKIKVDKDANIAPPVGFQKVTLGGQQLTASVSIYL